MRGDGRLTNTPSKFGILSMARIEAKHFLERWLGVLMESSNGESDLLANEQEAQPGNGIQTLAIRGNSETDPSSKGQ